MSRMFKIKSALQASITEYLVVFVIYAISSCVSVGGWLSFFVYPHYRAHREPPVTAKVTTEKPEPLFFAGSAFKDVAIEGRAYVVYDIVGHTVVASKNDTSLLPLASITKVMTSVSAISHAGRDTLLTISPKSIEGSYDLGLLPHQEWRLSELLKYVLVFSSNDGAEVVADSLGGKVAFVAQMNADAKALGLSFTFTDPAGRDEGSSIGGLGTARDVAKLFTIAREKIPDILDATTKKRFTATSQREKIRGIPNTNQEVGEFSGLEASKTGFTDVAGGNLAIIVDPLVGRPVVIVVLGSTKEGRFKDMEILYKALQKSSP